MKERLERLNLIRKLIHSQNIESQTALLEHVQKAGFDATQATLSRDLKLLKATQNKTAANCMQKILCAAVFLSIAPAIWQLLKRIRGIQTP